MSGSEKGGKKMSRYIDADAIQWHEDGWAFIYRDKVPSIDLDDYVPRDYYEKVVSEMAKRNVEAADIVRCKECERWWGNHWHDNEDGKCPMDAWISEDGFCSYGERGE